MNFHCLRYLWSFLYCCGFIHVLEYLVLIFLFRMYISRKTSRQDAMLNVFATCTSLMVKSVCILVVIWAIMGSTGDNSW
jgi:hypothetical protein